MRQDLSAAPKKMHNNKTNHIRKVKNVKRASFSLYRDRLLCKFKKRRGVIA